MERDEYGRFAKTLPRYAEWNGWAEYLQLHEHRTWWKVTSDIPEEEYSFLVERAIRDFEEITGVSLYLLGRSGRHVCVEDTDTNRKNYQRLRRLALELESDVIAEANEWKPEEE